MAYSLNRYNNHSKRIINQSPRDSITRLYPVAVTRVGDKNGDGLIDTINDPADSETLTYDDQGREKRGIDSDWHVVQREYDSVDRVIRATDALGLWRDYQYDANGNTLGEALIVSNARVDANVAVYDAVDRQVQVIDDAGNATLMEYDPAGNLTRITDPDGYSATLAYDANNHIVAAANKEGHTVVSSLDLDGKPRNVVDPNGNQQRFTYYGPEKNGRLKQSIDALGRITSYNYDAHGNVTAATDNLGRVSQTYYDALDRPVRSVGPAVAADGGRAPVTCTKYDTLGRPVELWAGSTLTPTAACDFSGVDPNLKRQAAWGYDDFGRNLKETDPLGRVWTQIYDRFGNVTETTDPKAQKTQLTWAYGHHLKTRTVRNANGSVYRTETTTRNLLGQPTHLEVRDGANTLILTQDSAFDAAHRVIQATDTRPGAPAKTRSYDWSPGGMLNATQDQNGARTDYLYDPVGQLIGIWAPNYDYLTFTHDAGGRLTEKWHPNGINSQYSWNPDNSLAAVYNRVAYSDAYTISRHDYVYDALGRRQSAQDKAGLLALPAQNDTYAYDALDNRSRKSVSGVNQHAIFDAANQLIELRSLSTTGAITHANVYDANGNLVSKCEGGTVTRTTTTCTGSSVTNFTWNPDDQLIAVSKPGITESYQYDHVGRRISKTTNGITTHYRYNGEDIDAEYSASWNETARYVHGPNTDDPNAIATYYHQDGINSVVATSTQAGSIAGAQLFDAWGNKVQSSGSIAQYGYTGREPDQTGLIYYRARYYDPTIGRFISRDPIGLQGGLNQYSYVNNNPINATDPTGLYSKLYNTNTNTAKISYAADLSNFADPFSSSSYNLSRTSQSSSAPVEEGPTNPWAQSSGGGIKVAALLGPGCNDRGMGMGCGRGGGGLVVDVNCTGGIMQKRLITLIILFGITLLAACAGVEHVSTQPRVSVYKYVGSVQCKGGGTPLATMMRQLSDAGIPVLNVSCGTDGRIYPAVCGATDGRIGILEVPEAKVSATATLGFAPLSGLPEASKTVCPKTP